MISFTASLRGGLEMRKCERLAENFYGVDMYCGKIDLTKHRASVFFFIVEHTEDEDFISKQAVQLLTVRCRDFHFFGKQEPIWHFGFDVVLCFYDAPELAGVSRCVIANGGIGAIKVVVDGTR